MFLNDNGTNEERQRLLPYVTRLACADTPEDEKARAAYIMRRICNYHYFGVAFDKGLEALEGALAIGRWVDPLGRVEVQPWMDAARAERRKPVRLAASAGEKALLLEGEELADQEGDRARSLGP
jgi:hypothetical protein